MIQARFLSPRLCFSIFDFFMSQSFQLQHCWTFEHRELLLVIFFDTQEKPLLKSSDWFESTWIPAVFNFQYFIIHRKWLAPGCLILNKIYQAFYTNPNYRTLWHRKCELILVVSGEKVTSKKENDLEQWYKHCNESDCVIFCIVHIKTYLIKHVFFSIFISLRFRNHYVLSGSSGFSNAGFWHTSQLPSLSFSFKLA